MDFFRETILRPLGLRGWCALKFLHALEIHQGFASAHPKWGGGPLPKKINREYLKFGLKFSLLEYNSFRLPLLREEFRLPKLTFHLDLRRRAASRRALPRTSSFHLLLSVFRDYITNCYLFFIGSSGLLRQLKKIDARFYQRYCLGYAATAR